MIELHQMLHGYRLGHNYVQGSIFLPSIHDMDKIATLSDWSEFVDKGGERDYITAYPLLESPYYVIAKSWYADEMRRPGCVWTHSLLIQRNDLRKITDYSQLLGLFKRPVGDGEDLSGYSKSILLNETSIYYDSKGFPSLTEAKVSELYAAMLLQQPVSILKEIDNTELQRLLLKLYNYLPSDLLWQKSFCSGTSLPRSYEGQLLSLQFVTHDGGNVSYLSNRIPYHGSQLVAVSLLNEQRQLPELIRYFDGELGDDVRRLRGFLEVVVLVNRVCKNDEEKQLVLLSILNQLSETFPQPTDGNNIKRSVLQPSLSRDLGGEENFLYTISTIDTSSFTQEQIDYINRLHDLSSKQFLSLVKQLYSSENMNEWGRQIVKSINNFVSFDDIAWLNQNDRVFFQTIISNNTALLNQIVWTKFSKDELESVLSIFSDREVVRAFKHWRELFKTLLELRVPIAKELARMVLSHDKECVNEYLTYINQEGNYPQLPVSKELELYSDAVLTWLSGVSYITHEVAYVLINSIDEDSPLVKNRGSKIWMPFANVLNERDPIQCYVFLYILSFNWQDRDALSYLRKAFYPIHTLLAQDKLDYNLWYRIEPYTEHLFFTFWDKCKKMRKMIIKRLKDAGCLKSAIANYTPDAMVNKWLISEW